MPKKEEIVINQQADMQGELHTLHESIRDAARAVLAIGTVVAMLWIIYEFGKRSAHTL